MHRWIIAFIALALMVQAGWANGEAATNEQNSASDTDFLITPDHLQNNVVFHAVVVGDSVAWGTGLNRDEKYSYLVAKWLAEKLGRPVNVKILARTGATIDRVPCDSNSPTNYPPELSSGRPTLMEQADAILNPTDVDLILVSGGANDVGLDKLMMLTYPLNGLPDCSKLVWGSTVDDIRKRSEDIRPYMYNLLIKLLTKCPNARVVVTGYYTGISDGSKGITEAVAAIRPDSQNLIFPDYQKLDEKPQKDQLVEKSKIFYQTSNKSLSEAVDEANGAMLAADSRNLPYDRAAFSPIFFPSDRCYGTDQSWLWKIDDANGQIKTNDHMFATRVSLLKNIDKYCECEPCSSGSTISQTDTGTNSKPNSLTLNLPPIDGNAESTQPIGSGIDCNKYRRDKLDAVGHPNVEGAKNYSESIIRGIRAKWPTWLHPTVEAFDVSSRSLTSGESLEITYKVSDNGGSGLKHVELWRTQEKDKWPKDPIQTKALAGQTGPVSGSFTDSPSAPGKYWYGVHVVDNAGNWNDQKNSNTNGQPSGFEPMEVEVKGVATSTGVSSQAPREEWNRTFGGPGNDRALSVLPTKDGGYILGGGTASFGVAGENAWLIKADANGNELWNRTFGGADKAWAGPVQVATDGGFFVSMCKCGKGLLAVDPEIYACNSSTIRIDSQGNEVWRKFASVLIKLTSDDGYIMAGSLDRLLVKTDAQGHEIWQKTISRGNGFCGIDWIKLTSDGGYILVAWNSTYDSETQILKKNWLLIKTDVNGNEVWKKDFDLNKVIKVVKNWNVSCTTCLSVYPTTDGGYILVGGMNSSEGRYAWLIKTDAQGNEIWKKSFNEYDAFLLRPTSDGGYVFTCRRQCQIFDSSDSLLIKIDSKGNEVWNKKFEGKIKAIQLSPDNGYILSCIKESVVSGTPDSWLIRIDAKGNEVWSKTIRGEIYDIQLTQDGGYILAGDTKSYGRGGSDAWLIKVAPG